MIERESQRPLCYALEITGTLFLLRERTLFRLCLKSLRIKGITVSRGRHHFSWQEIYSLSASGPKVSRRISIELWWNVPTFTILSGASEGVVFPSKHCCQECV